MNILHVRIVHRIVAVTINKGFVKAGKIYAARNHGKQDGIKNCRVRISFEITPHQKKVLNKKRKSPKEDQRE